MAVTDDDSSADEVEPLPALKAEVPDILIVAHNGLLFDYAMLLTECYRAFLPVYQLPRWKYVDTLSVARAIGTRMFGCMKLQCMRCTTGRADGLRAHRALDDAVALKEVVCCMAESFGVPVLTLLAPFARELDVSASVAQLSSVV